MRIIRVMVSGSFEGGRARNEHDTEQVRADGRSNMIHLLSLCLASDSAHGCHGHHCMAARACCQGARELTNELAALPTFKREIPCFSQNFAMVFASRHPSPALRPPNAWRHVIAALRAKQRIRAAHTRTSSNRRAASEARPQLDSHDIVRPRGGLRYQHFEDLEPCTSVCTGRCPEIAEDWGGALTWRDEDFRGPPNLGTPF